MSVLAIAVLVVSVWILKHYFVWKPLNLDNYYRQTPLVFAHRGIFKRVPENTLSAYLEVAKQQVPALEMDVVMTRDGRVICSHNFDLERETDGSGFINDFDYEELGTILTGVRTGNGNEERLPLLEEVAERLPKDLRLNIEIKSNRLFDFRTAMKVAGMVKNKTIPQPTIISSFNPLAIWAVKWVDSNIPTGFILETMEYFPFVNLAHPDCLHPAAELLTADLAKYARDRGLRINVWTVNNKPAIRWLLNLGVDGIITDRPEFLEYQKRS